MTEYAPKDIMLCADSEAAHAGLMQILAPARHKIEILSHHLDPKLFDQQDLCAEISRIARSGRYANIRLLVQNTDLLCQYDHRLVQVQNRLSSFIQIRQVHPQWRDLNQAFVLTDQYGLLYLQHAQRYEGEISLYAPARVRELQQLFTQIWALSEPDPRLRQLA